MNEIDVVEPLTPEEIALESAIVEQIKQGMEFANKSYFMIIDGLKRIKDLRLYREMGSLRDWALAHFGFGDREYNYYLKAGEVVHNIRAVDPTANPKLTHALAIGMLEPEDQIVLWEKIKQLDKPLTKKLIINTAKSLERNGIVKARDGVNIKPDTDSSYLTYRIKISWASIEDDFKIDLITSILAKEPDAFLSAVVKIAEDELAKRNEDKYQQ